LTLVAICLNIYDSLSKGNSLKIKGGKSMEEYRMIKCLECGHERRGPRIIRLSDWDKASWNAIFVAQGRLYKMGAAVFLLSMLIGVSTAVWILIFFGNFSKEFNRPYFGNGWYEIAVAGLPYFIIVIAPFLLWNRHRDKKVNDFERRRREILDHYNVKREEDFEIE